jgi:hypothetical protein
MFTVDTHLLEKWNPLLNLPELDPIKDSHRRAVTAQLLENTENSLRDIEAFDRGSLLTESPTNSANAPGFSGGYGSASAAAGPVAGFDPILISLIRRAMPNLVAYDLAGVQPMNGPAGLIFAMRSRYTNQSGAETFFDEVNTSFSGQNSGFNLAGFGSTAAGIGTTTQRGSNPGLLNPTETSTEVFNVGQGMETGDAENLGNGVDNQFNEMSFSIERVPVQAQSRALAGEYSLELMQDLKAIHNLSAEGELANILSTEILSEINREVMRTIYLTAEQGAVNNVATPGVFDLDIDSNGRWSVEKFKGLIYQIERDANAINQRTRRGKGNVITCSADVASALTMAGVLDYTPALDTNLNVDDSADLFAGTMQRGRYRVYIDPFMSNVSNTHFYVVGYKGKNAMDAGLFYCPYIPLQMVRAVDPKTFQPRLGFKSRYGMVANPYAEGLTQGLGRLRTNSNRYYRRVAVRNLM